MRKPQDVIEENKRRRSIYFGCYNPFTGEGSLIDRAELKFFDTSSKADISIKIPVSMLSIPMFSYLYSSGDMDDTIRQAGLRLNDGSRQLFMSSLIDARLDHDFEFYSVVALRIQDKESKLPIPFILNYPQRFLLLDLERMRLSGVPIRIVLLKARQWGGSTLVQMYMGWLQNRKFTGWHSIVMADVEDQARNIRGMYSKMAKWYPRELGTITLKPYEGSTKTRIMAERDCIIGVGSIQKPENTRSYDLAMAHLSEVGLWKSTKTRSAEDLAQALSAAIPRKQNTLLVKESTAKGSGNYFHNEWIAAETGKSGYAAVFVPWFYIPLYQEEVKDKVAFISTWTEYQWWQWEQGATVEGIKWYISHQRAEGFDDWRMKSEYPTTADEAFQSTGRRVFAPSYTLNAKATCIDPLYKGDLFGNDLSGKGSLKDIRFEDTPEGRLWVWAKPDTSIKVSNRYCVFVDIGGRTEEADYSVIKVIDRYWMMHGGAPEVVATWRGHIDQDLLAWKAAQIATWYDNALMAVEVNSLNTKTDGDHSYTILDEIADDYPNLYTRTRPDQVKEGVPAVYGFHTNNATKGMIIDTLNAALREKAYIERDVRAYHEMDWFEFKKDGTMGAVDGRNDDILICTAGAVWLAIKYMPPPKEIDFTATLTHKRKITGEASF